VCIEYGLITVGVNTRSSATT